MVVPADAIVNQGERLVAVAFIPMLGVGRQPRPSYARRSPPRPAQAGVLSQAKLRGRVDGRVRRHARRLHGLVPGQEDQDGVRHEHHGPSTQTRSCGMIGGDGINDESNKTHRPHRPNFY